MVTHMNELTRQKGEADTLKSGVLDPTRLQLVSSLTGQLMALTNEPMKVKAVAAVMTSGKPMPISAYVNANVRYIRSRQGLRLTVTPPMMAFAARVRSRPRSGRARRVRRLARPAAGRADPPAPGPGCRGGDGGLVGQRSQGHVARNGEGRRRAAA
jgi:hypothetical protein